MKRLKKLREFLLSYRSKDFQLIIYIIVEARFKAKIYCDTENPISFVGVLRHLKNVNVLRIPSWRKTV